MAVVLELEDQEFKTTVITILRALMDRQRARTEEQVKQRGGNPKKEQKRNARY